MSPACLVLEPCLRGLNARIVDDNIAAIGFADTPKELEQDDKSMNSSANPSTDRLDHKMLAME